jgi:CO/xanthine dehydrogenase FAD-binding subunit
LLVRRTERAEVLVDLFGLSGLDEIRREGEVLCIGALTRQRAVERSPIVVDACPMLAEGLAHVGHPATRNRGTIGGSIAHADPAAELPTIAFAVGATAVVRSADGNISPRPVAQLLTGYRSTALRPGELIIELRLPAARVGEGQAWIEFGPRFADLPIVGVAAILELDSEERVSRARAALGGVGPTPADVSDSLTGLLRGQPPTTTLLDGAARNLADTLAVESDLRASAAMRRWLAATLLTRALVRAADRAAVS